MTTQSFEKISSYYDLIYQDKDYGKEVDFVESIFLSFGKPSKVLEVGCGTGNYTELFLKRGYEMVGLDISENMLEVARAKCPCKFVQNNIVNMSLGESFDATIALFAVISYITDNSDIIHALKNIRSNLASNGLFVFDVWNGLAVMRTLPELRVKEVENQKVKIFRIANPKLRPFEHICEVNYKMIVLDKRTNLYEEFDEKHTVRFFFPQEIKNLLNQAGFEVLKFCPFLDLNGKVDETVWNMTVVARASEANV